MITLHSFAQALHMIKDIGAPNVVVHLDTYHMNIEEASMSKAIRNCQAAGRLGYAPLNPDLPLDPDLLHHQS